MNPIKSIMGRRQFIITAGATSAAALAYKKLGKIFNSDIQSGTAMASERDGAENVKGAYSDKYSHLLSPLKIGNVVLKNRFMQADGYPFFMQGPETFPSEQVISWYSNVAKNGCAIVMCWPGGDPSEKEGGHKGMPVWDRSDPRVQNYFAQMTDAVHFHGSKAAIGLKRVPAVDENGYSISNLVAHRNWVTDEINLTQGKEAPIKLLQKMIEDHANEAKFYKSLGFDMVHFHMSYRRYLLATALSPVLNVRKDKYGGSLENRARLPLEIFQAIKKACGQDFLIGAHMSGEEMGGGYTVQELAEYAKIWEGALDFLVVRGKTDKVSHASPFDFNYDNNPILGYAQTLKESGTKVIIAPNGGFQDLDLNEEYIASGKCDMISMSRTWWVDTEYGKKAYEGRGEDVVPCLRCNDCHGVQGPPLSFCTVNPEFGHEHRINRMIDEPTISRKVAVIGGGPAGMKAAIVAAERGHKVTLYEKNDFLGGQLKHADYVSFKWTCRDYKDYLVRQVKKSGVEVLLSTKATPEMIKGKGYDAVLVAIGVNPVIPDIPGADGRNVLTPIFVFGNKSLGKNIVVIGGDQIGTETGMYLAEKGHNVTVLTAERRLATDANGIYLGPKRWYHLKTFNFFTEVTATGISKDKVTYVDAKGNEKSIRADNVVIDGRKPRLEEALNYYGSAKRFFMIGDCSDDGGNIRKSIRTAFTAASKI